MVPTIKLSTFITTVIWTTMSKKTIQLHTGLTWQELLWETLLNLLQMVKLSVVFAPEAQLMFLRVFSDTKGGQVENFIYTKAVERCGPN